MNSPRFQIISESLSPFCYESIANSDIRDTFHIKIGRWKCTHWGGMLVENKRLYVRLEYYVWFVDWIFYIKSLKLMWYLYLMERITFLHVMSPNKFLITSFRVFTRLKFHFSKFFLIKHCSHTLKISILLYTIF